MYIVFPHNIVDSLLFSSFFYEGLSLKRIAEMYHLSDEKGSPL